MNDYEFEGIQHRTRADYYAAVVSAWAHASGLNTDAEAEDYLRHAAAHPEAVRRVILDYWSINIPESDFLDAVASARI